eukprot:1865817-Amphidinium_carterae.1
MYRPGTRSPTSLWTPGQERCGTGAMKRKSLRLDVLAQLPWLPPTDRPQPRSLRSTERVFIKVMQVAGKLPNNKSAFGYKPTWRQLGRIRAFMDHNIDFSNFEIWGDSEGEQEEPLTSPAATKGSGEPNPQPASAARGSGEPAPRATPAELFVSKKPRTFSSPPASPFRDEADYTVDSDL